MPPNSPPSPRPCEILGEKNIGLLKSSGFSSSHTFSSFCHSVIMPSMRRAPCVTVANGGTGGPLAAAGLRAALTRPGAAWLAPLAGAAAAEAASLAAARPRSAAAWAVSVAGVVAQPHRKATQADARAVSGEIERNWGMESGYVKGRMVPAREKVVKSVSDYPVRMIQYV